MKCLFGAALVSFALYAHASDDITVAGSDLLNDIIGRSSASFTEQSGINVIVNLKGSPLGFEALERNDADICIIALPEGRERPGDSFQTFPFAFQIVVLAVHVSNPLEQISLPQLASVFGNQVDDRHSQWSDLGLGGMWQNRKITVNSISENYGITLDLFREIILDGQSLKPNISFWETTEALTDQVFEDNSAIVALPDIPVDRRLKVLSVAKDKSGFAFGPTLENIFFGDYPIRLLFLVVAKKNPSAPEKAYIRFLLSAEIGQVLAETGFLPVPENVRRQQTLGLDSLN